MTFFTFKNIFKYIATMSCFLFVSGVIGFITSPADNIWYQHLVKSALTPPSWVFPMVWTFLYMILALQTVWLYNQAVQVSQTVKSVFILHLLANWAWSPVFFIFQSPKMALVLIALIAMLASFLAQEFFKKSAFLGCSWLPYLAWIGLATYLNFMIVLLNPN